MGTRFGPAPTPIRDRLYCCLATLAVVAAVITLLSTFTTLGTAHKSAIGAAVCTLAYAGFRTILARLRRMRVG